MLKIVSFHSAPEETQRSWFSDSVKPNQLEIVVIHPDTSEDEICKVVKGATLLLKGPGKPFLNRRILEAAEGIKLVARALFIPVKKLGN
jgi:hypothetical protein